MSKDSEVIADDPPTGLSRYDVSSIRMDDTVRGPWGEGEELNARHKEEEQAPRNQCWVYARSKAEGKH